MGYLLYRKNQHDEADKYFSRAVELDSKSALAYYYHAMLVMSGGHGQQEMIEARTALEKAVALNPKLAPAWANLGMLYSQDPDTLDKALAAAKLAVQTMPGEPHFQFNLAVVLARMERYDEARAMAHKFQNSADPAIASAAEQLLARLDQGQQYAAFKKTNEAPPPTSPPINHDTQSGSDSSVPVMAHRMQAATTPTATSSASTSAPPSSADSSLPAAVNSSRSYSMTGTIAEVDCAGAPQLQITLKAMSLAMRLHSEDMSQVVIKSPGTNSIAKNTGCSALRGRAARVSYQLVSGKTWDGEIVSIEFQ